MKTFFLFCVFAVLCFSARAGHIAGGEMFYRYVGPGTSSATDRYEITLRLFRQCHPPAVAGVQTAPMPDFVYISLFDGGNMSHYQDMSVSQSSFKTISLGTPSPCITGYREVCYQVAEFTFTSDLPKNTGGYVAAFQTCCRSASVINVAGATQEGATYTCVIPGSTILRSQTNTNAVFDLKDTVLICAQKNIRLDFSATDADNDSLSYRFESAYNRGKTTNSTPTFPSNPPYVAVGYISGFSGALPLGGAVRIDSRTGLVTGKVGGDGAYVVNVVVTEWRNGVAIAEHRKELLVVVAPCDYASVDLPSSLINCSDFSQHFENGSMSSTIHSYAWDFGVAGTNADTSNSPTPDYVYKDTGTYTVSLVVNKGEQCSDSSGAIVRIYPGFKPGFSVNGVCFITPYKFTDQTTSKYGTVNSWQWNFGVDTSFTDTSSLKNPVYQYKDPGTVNVVLIVGDNRGCIDTSVKTMVIPDKPSLNLRFRDTLICSIDTLALHAGISGGVLTWDTNRYLINPSSTDPLVFPKDTTLFYVNVDNNGCKNRDSVKVNVLPFISVRLPADTSVCATDSFTLRPVSDALQYLWSPSTGLNNTSVKYPLASPPSGFTTYTVIANLGKCQDRASTRIKVAPYPVANAGSDQLICYGKTTFLNAAVTGSSFSWSPTSSMLNAGTLHPTAGPVRTTLYVLTVRDTLGCPKPVYDSVLVTVDPQLHPSAGRDTTMVSGQDLTLHALGGVNYIWFPATYMTQANTPDPTVKLSVPGDVQTFNVIVSDSAGCTATASVRVTVVEGGPDIMVPSAFTPNGDGHNDVIRPVLKGIRQLNYFHVYNRWGQLLYSTADASIGWNGTLSGTPQPAGTYVYTAEAIDYKGHPVHARGTIVLIR